MLRKLYIFLFFIIFSTISLYSNEVRIKNLNNSFNISFLNIAKESSNKIEKDIINRSVLLMAVVSLSIAFASLGEVCLIPSYILTGLFLTNMNDINLLYAMISMWCVTGGIFLLSGIFFTIWVSIVIFLDRRPQNRDRKVASFLLDNSIGLRIKI